MRRPGWSLSKKYAGVYSHRKHPTQKLIVGWVKNQLNKTERFEVIVDATDELQASCIRAERVTKIRGGTATARKARLTVSAYARSWLEVQLDMPPPAATQKING